MLASASNGKYNVIIIHGIINMVLHVTKNEQKLIFTRHSNCRQVGYGNKESNLNSLIWVSYVHSLLSLEQLFETVVHM